MAEPSKERIAAALALAEAVDAAARACDAPEGTPPDLFQRAWQARCDALAAYRATAPKLRTRSEVDAERLLNLDAFRAGVINGCALINRDEALCREETAPDPTELGTCPPDCEGCQWLQGSRHRCAGPGPVTPIGWDNLCAKCASESKAEELSAEPDPLVQQTLAADEPEACGCEESEALKAQLDRCRAIVRALRRSEVSAEAAARTLERELGR